MDGSEKGPNGATGDAGGDAAFETAKDLLRIASEFQARGIEARERCRGQFREAEREEDNNLRIWVDGQIAALATKMYRPVANVDPAISYQIGTCASFVRSHFIVSDLILNGDLVEAVTLIRKQLESLARLHELDSKPLAKLHGQTPNIGMLFRAGGGKMYGDLSEVAHFSKPRVAELMRVMEDGERIGPSILPVFTEHSFACLDMHHFVAIYFLVWITEKLSEWYPNADFGVERRLLYFTITYAEKIGVIRFPDRPASGFNSSSEQS